MLCTKEVGKIQEIVGPQLTVPHPKLLDKNILSGLKPILNTIHPADFDALHKMSIGPNIVQYTRIHGTT